MLQIELNNCDIGEYAIVRKIGGEIRFLNARSWTSERLLAIDLIIKQFTNRVEKIIQKIPKFIKYY